MFHRRLDARWLTSTTFTRSDGELASLVVDGRLLDAEVVREVARRAQREGRAFVLYDIDAPFELTLLGVMMRDPFAGADPVPPFGELTRGFREARNNRQEVIDWFSSSEAVGRYELYVAGLDGHISGVPQSRREDLILTCSPKPSSPLRGRRFTSPTSPLSARRCSRLPTSTTSWVRFRPRSRTGHGVSCRSTSSEDERGRKRDRAW